MISYSNKDLIIIVKCYKCIIKSSNYMIIYILTIDKTKTAIYLKD